jgi:thioredoxin 1
MAATFTDENFKAEVLESETPVLVDFWAAWCGPCQMMGPVVEALAEEWDGKIKVGKVNVDECPNTAQEYGITSIPVFKIFKGGEIVGEVVGATSKEALAEKVTEATGA